MPRAEIQEQASTVLGRLPFDDGSMNEGSMPEISDPLSGYSTFPSMCP